MEQNYSKICSELIKGLPPRHKEVVFRRFGLAGGERETLESIGQSHKITRERVRQIQNDALSRLKPNAEKYQKIFQSFVDHIRFAGDLRKEDSLLLSLGGQKFQNQIFFLLSLNDSFSRFSETDDHHSFWTVNPESFSFARKLLDSFYNTLSQESQPLKLEDLSPQKILRNRTEKEKINRLSYEAFLSYLEISKKIEQNQEGMIGLREWPEINPRGVRDKAYLVFKKEQKPLHFKEVTKLISPTALSQTVHNELIKDSRFVLVGRGIYALKEWGYQEGQVKDVILWTLKEAKRPLSKKEVLEKVLEQRMVKESTILLNLSNKKYFLRDLKGRYQVNPVRKSGALGKTTLT